MLVAVEATAIVPPPAADEVVYAGFRRSELAREYSPRATVPDSLDIFERWWADGEAARARARASGRASFDVRYGPDPRQTFDLYRPAGSPAPLHLLIHGGYFQAMDKANHAQFAEALVGAGLAVAVLNYDLCPGTGVERVVEQTREALLFLRRRADALGIARGPIQLSGHSVGATLGALMMAERWPGDVPIPSISRAVLISGLYDLEPLAHTPLNRVLKLDGDLVRRLSPGRLRPPVPPERILLVVGTEESCEFHRQSNDFRDAWSGAGVAVDLLELPGHHFSVLAHLREPAGPLVAWLAAAKFG